MIILTGSSGGIGMEIAKPLSEIESLFALSNIHEPAFADGEKLDITNIQEIKKFVDKNKKELSHITLIHLAAVKIDELAVFCNEINWDKVMDVNLKGAFFLTRELLPIMTKEKWGRIIFIISAGLGDVGTLTYSTSKFGLLGMSEVLSKEYARFGITSNILQLGYFDAGLYKKLPEDKQKELLEQIPSRKLGDPINIVNAIEFIIKSDFVNGAILNIDGGI